MKNVIILLASLFVTFISTQGQVTQCVSCNNNTIDTTKYSSAIGTENTSTGLSSFAGGTLSQATGDYSFGFGYTSISTGLHSIALGSESKATQTYGIAIGRHAYSTNANAIAIGKYAEASGVSSFSLGTNLLNSAGFSVLIGNGAGFSTKLQNTTNNSLIIGFNSTVPTLFVGPSNGSNYSGKVGIGNITAPTAKLHIKADNNEDASLKLEPAGSSYFAKIIFNDEDHIIASNLNNGLTFKTPGTTAFHFEEGNIGIGTEEPQAKLQVNDGDIFIEDIDRGIIMKSPDGNCWRGTLDNSGALHFVQVDCNNLTTGYKQTYGSQSSGAKIYPNPAGDMVFINIDSKYTGTTLEISDLSGNTIYSEKLKNAESYIDMSMFHAGLYIFRIVNGNGEEVLSEKVIKQ
jgi:hypothetical protein